MSASYVGGEPNFENRTLYHGDNLDFLRGMNSETVHLIATDPPFNKNRDFYATPDKLAAGAKFQDRWIWKDETHGGWFNRLYETHREAWYAIMCAFQSYGSDMGAFIAFLSVRLIEMHRILRNDGCISLHCDQTASHYIKGLMDAIFGSRNFRNEIIWMRDPAGKGAKRRSNQWPRNFDSILLYSKSADYTFTQQFTELNEHQKKAYRYQDEVGRYKAVQRGDYTDKSMAKFRAEGKIHVSKTGKEYIKYYLKDAKATIGSVWTDIYGFGTITASKERTGFPTQKPLALYERIILASSNKGDIVLDPFCGCATTPVAAERLKRHWVGMDIWDEAYKQVIDRLERDTVLR
ncbi:MAG: site-specific DNA-methyltransferase, partial [Chloroflexi bacterium]|nr:site-specific DNA-methyltransferase [Chloroflexota bacterium]